MSEYKWYVKIGLIDELQSVLNNLEIQYCKIHTVGVFSQKGEIMYVIVAKETIETQLRNHNGGNRHSID